MSKETRERRKRTYWSNLAIGIGNGADDSGSKDTAAFVGDGVEGVKGGFVSRRDELAEQGAAVAAEAAEDEAVDRTKGIHFPLLLQAKIAQALDGGEVAEKAVEGYDFEEEDAAEDGLGRGEAEVERYASPEKGAKDAGDGGDNVDEGKHGVAHSEGGFGEEHGGTRDGGYAVGEQEPGGEEEKYILKMARMERCAA